MSETLGEGLRGADDEQRRDELAGLSRLHGIAVEFLRDGDLSRLLDASLAEALSIAGADRGCLQILHGAGGGVRLGAQRGLVRPFLEHVANLRVGLGGNGVTTAEPHVVVDVARSPAFAASADGEALLAAEVRTLHAIPLRTPDGRVVGALSLLHRDAHPEPSRAPLDALDRVAELTAAAIAHAPPATERAPRPSDAALAVRLRATEELFRNTVENLPVSMVLCDREGRVLYVDPALGEMVRALCGLTPAALVGKPGGEIWPPFVWDPLEANLRKAVETGQRQTYDLAFTVPSGEVNHRHWIVVPLAGDDGRVHRVLGINHDVTAERRLLDELRGADRRKSEFIGVLSHELRNPLSAIRSALGVLEQDDAVDRDAARGIIDRQTRHLVHLVDDLLDITRVSQNKIQLKRQPVDLARVVRDAIEDNRGHLTKHGVRLEARLVAGPLPANVDAVRIAQVIANLLSNAAKFTPEGGTVTVSLDSRDGTAVLTMTDTGSGIEAAAMPRLFEPFVQAERTLNRAGGGLGLGLALVRALVELHGGSVSAHSAGSGQGATFIVRLPLALTGAAESTGGAPALAPRRRRVLVIDDDEDLTIALKLALRSHGHDVAVARDGLRGLDAARAFKPDLVLCDIRMPGMDGYDVARAFRADPALRDILLVAHTGYAQAVDRDKAREAGFDEHLAKPADMAQIRALLAGAR